MASLLTLTVGGALISLAPTAAAHDCESTFGPVGCGQCSDLDHSGTHTWTVGQYNFPYCEPLSLPGDVGGEDPVCTVITALSIGNCDGSEAAASSSGDCTAPTGPVQCGPTCRPGEDKYLRLGDVEIQYC